MPAKATPANVAAAVRAADIARRAEVSPAAIALLTDDLPPEEYLHALADKGLFEDAYAFAAWWLSKRQAVWWACQCAWSLYRPTAPEKEAAALRAAVRWVQDPGEKQRRACETAANAAGMTPAGAIALAVFFSSGSMLAANLPDVPPPPELTPRTLGQAVLLAALQAAPASQPAGHACFLALAVDVARGKNLWNQEKS